MRLVFIFLGILGLCSTAFAEDPAPIQDATPQSIKEVNYLCERNVELPVVYINGLNNENYAVALIEGNLTLMKQHKMASGVSYIAIDEQASYRLQTKGTQASVIFMEASDDAVTYNVLNACESYEEDSQE